MLAIIAMMAMIARLGGHCNCGPMIAMVALIARLPVIAMLGGDCNGVAMIAMIAMICHDGHDCHAFKAP